MTHRCVLNKYRQPFLQTSKGEQEKWWGINRKFQFVGQSIITTFEWANWKWTHWELSRVQLNTHSGAAVPAEEEKRKEKQKSTYLELNAQQLWTYRNSLMPHLSTADQSRSDQYISIYQYGDHFFIWTYFTFSNKGSSKNY